MLSFIIYMLVGVLWMKYEMGNRLKDLVDSWYPEYVFENKIKGKEYLSKKSFSTCITIVSVIMFVFLWPALLIAVIMRMFISKNNGGK